MSDSSQIGEQASAFPRFDGKKGGERQWFDFTVISHIFTIFQFLEEQVQRGVTLTQLFVYVCEDRAC